MSVTTVDEFGRKFTTTHFNNGVVLEETEAFGTVSAMLLVDDEKPVLMFFGVPVNDMAVFRSVLGRGQSVVTEEAKNE